jgi:hypothetical protein
MMKDIKLTSIETAADCSDDDLESQESAHAIQHWAVLIVNAVYSDHMDHWRKGCY